MAFVTIFIMGVLFSGAGLLFPEGVCRVFVDLNEEMAQIAGRGIRIYFLAFLPMGINLLISYYLQAVLCSRESLWISLLRNVILSGVLILVLPVLFGGSSLWMVMPVVEAVVVVVSILFLRRYERKKL